MKRIIPLLLLSIAFLAGCQYNKQLASNSINRINSNANIGCAIGGCGQSATSSEYVGVNNVVKSGVLPLNVC